MSSKMKILNFLKSSGKQYCDDCLSAILKIYPRQQVNQICRKLSKNHQIHRKRGLCSNCFKYKIVNWVTAENEEVKAEVLPQNKHVERDKTSTKRLSPNEFENRVREYLERTFKRKFSKKPLQVGPNKSHKFDLVSDDGTIVVECKSYSWTKSGNFPSGKISTAIEALFYLSRIKADKKVLVFQDDINSQGESLVDVFVRRYDGIMDDVEVWAYAAGSSVEEDKVRIVRISRTTTTVRVGRGYALRIPRRVAEALGIEEGDLVAVEVKNGEARLRPVKRPRLGDYWAEVGPEEADEVGEELSRRATG